MNTLFYSIEAMIERRFKYTESACDKRVQRKLGLHSTIKYFDSFFDRIYIDANDVTVLLCWEWTIWYE
jgi:hypothetical protein